VASVPDFLLWSQSESVAAAAAWPLSLRSLKITMWSRQQPVDRAAGFRRLPQQLQELEVFLPVSEPLRPLFGRYHLPEHLLSLTLHHLHCSQPLAQWLPLPPTLTRLSIGRLKPHPDPLAGW